MAWIYALLELYTENQLSWGHKKKNETTYTTHKFPHKNAEMMWVCLVFFILFAQNISCWCEKVFKLHWIQSAAFNFPSSAIIIICCFFLSFHIFLLLFWETRIVFRTMVWYKTAEKPLQAEKFCPSQCTVYLIKSTNYLGFLYIHTNLHITMNTDTTHMCRPFSPIQQYVCLHLFNNDIAVKPNQKYICMCFYLPLPTPPLIALNSCFSEIL